MSARQERLELASRVCLALMRTGGRMAVGFDQRFADQGLTQAQFRLLLAVWTEGESEGVAPSVLADHLLIERATVSSLETRLIERGLLQRLPSANRRSHRLALTEAGGQALEWMGVRATLLGRETLAVFGDDDLETFHRLLGRLEEQLRAQARQRQEPTRS